MPKLQEYISQGGISRGRSLVVSPSQIDTRGVSGAISEAGKAILEAEQAMVRVRDFRETTEGMNFVYDKSRAIKSLSREDDGFDPTRYFAELNNTVTDAAKNITGEIAREEFILKAQRQVDAIKADIRDSFRAREIKAGQAGHGYQKKMGLDAVGDMTDAEEVTMINGVRRSLEEGLGLLWNQDYVDYEMKTFEKDIVMAKATYQTITNPEGFLGIIEKDVDKIYELLDDAEKAGFVSDARKNLLDYEAQERNNASIQLSALYREDNLTMDSLNVIQANNPLMTDKEYDKWAKVIENRDSITGEANSSVFYDLSSEFMKAVGTKKLDKLKTKSFNRKQIKNILNVRMKLLDAENRGEVNREKAKTLHGWLDDALENNARFMEKYSNYLSLIDKTLQWSKNVSSNYYNSISEKVTPEQMNLAMEMGMNQVDNKSLAMEVFSDILNQLQSKKAVQPQAKFSPGEFENQSNIVMYEYNKKIANALYTIVSDEGKEKVEINGSYYDILGYSDGQPIVKFEEINAGSSE